MDADGQHLPADIDAVCRAWRQNPEALVLGSRRFTGKVPLRSRFGNAITRFIFRVATGVAVYDTQTGLRAFSVSRIPMMLEMQGERYEYEINVLLYATRRKIPIQEVEIATVYLDGNQTSHFNPLRDAWRIYKMILLFAASSLVAAGVDYGLVLLFSYLVAAGILAANYGLLALLESWMPLAIAKLIVEAVLYPASFLLQRKYVFTAQVG